MSIDKLRNAMARHGRDAVGATQKNSDEGLISAFDPVTQSAKVTLQPSGAETGWVPIRTPWAGDGWGMFSPPSIDDAVTVHYENGDINSPSIHLRAHNDIDQPLPVPSGELWLVHKRGQGIKLLNSGNIVIGGAPGAPGSIMLGDPAALHQMLTEVAMAVFNVHTHTEHGAGQQTSQPTQQMSAATALTQQVRAS